MSPWGRKQFLGASQHMSLGIDLSQKNKERSLSSYSAYFKSSFLLEYTVSDSWWQKKKLVYSVSHLSRILVLCLLFCLKHSSSFSDFLDYTLQLWMKLLFSVAIAHLSLLSYMIHAIWAWLKNWRVIVIVIVVQGVE